MSKKTSYTTKLSSDWSLIPIGIVIAIIGICFIAFSSIIEYLALAIGIFVIIGATVLATAALIGKRGTALFVIKIVFAAAALAAGIVTIIFNTYVAAIVCIVFAGLIAIDGSVKLGSFIVAKQYSAAGKTVMLIFSLLTTASALAMVRFTPSEINDENIKTASIIIGITFILDAVCNIVSPFLKHNIKRSLLSDIEEQKKAAEDSASTEEQELTYIPELNTADSLDAEAPEIPDEREPFTDTAKQEAAADESAEPSEQEIPTEGGEQVAFENF